MRGCEHGVRREEERGRVVSSMSGRHKLGPLLYVGLNLDGKVELTIVKTKQSKRGQKKAPESVK